MKILDLSGLYSAYNDLEDFKVLIVAEDLDMAKNIAEDYRIESDMCGKFEVEELSSLSEDFDCDYVLVSSEER